MGFVLRNISLQFYLNIEYSVIIMKQQFLIGIYLAVWNRKNFDIKNFFYATIMFVFLCLIAISINFIVESRTGADIRMFYLSKDHESAILIVRNASVIPTKLQFVGESVLKYFGSITAGSMGEEESKKHNPLILTLFMFILTANLVGQIPFKIVHLAQGELASPNNDINMTAAMAVIVLIYYVSAGIAKKKFKFFLHGFSFVDIILFLVELLEMITRPLTLALRLFGNILAGEILIGALIGICAWGLPLPIMFFELLVACVQALVFMMLTMVYISTAIKEEH